MIEPEILTLKRITLYPIKSLPGVDVPEAEVTPGGGLQMDRGLAMLDADGQFVNGKRNATVHRIRASYDLISRQVTLSTESRADTSKFHLDEDRVAIGAWLSEQFGQPIRLVAGLEQGFPDDRSANGPTLVSHASLAEVASWFEGTSAEQMHRRFRVNLEIDGVEPFWEDQLVAADGSVIRFQIGDIPFEGVNICRRCVVPTRDPSTGEAISGFARRFAEHRQSTLPNWSPRSRFDHYYRLTINTRISATAASTRLRVGDPLIGSPHH